MNSESEVNIKDIESEVSPRGESIPRLDTVDSLSFVVDVISEDTERDVERSVFHHHNRKTWRESDSGVHISRAGVFRDTVIGSCKVGVSGGESEFHFVVYSESRSTTETDILSCLNCGGVRFGTVKDVMDIESEVFIEVHGERVEISSCRSVTESETEGEVVSYEIGDVRFYGEGMSGEVTVRDEGKELKVFSREFSVGSRQADAPYPFRDI